jgi:hypothetical protein
MSKVAFLRPKNSIKKIELPELESPVHIRKWSAAERIEFTNKSVTSVSTDGKAEIDTQKVLEQQIRLLQFVICDESGNRMFNDSDEDYKELSEVNDDIIQLLWTEAWNFNNSGKPALDEAIKNSEASQT